MPARQSEVGKTRNNHQIEVQREAEGYPKERKTNQHKHRLRFCLRSSNRRGNIHSDCTLLLQPAARRLWRRDTREIDREKRDQLRQDGANCNARIVTLRRGRSRRPAGGVGR